MNNQHHSPTTGVAAATSAGQPPAAQPGPHPARGTLLGKALLLLALANGVALLAYLFYTYQLQFHSDAAVANILAQEIADTGQLFPEGWNYVNKDLWVFFTHTWVIVLLPLFTNDYALHAAAGVIGAALTLAATWGMGGILGMSRPARLFSVALFGAGFTPVMSEHIYGQQAYGTIFYFACGILLCGWHFMQAGPGTRIRWRWGAGCALLVLLVAWANPQRALIYYLLPLLAGATAMTLLRLLPAPGAAPQAQSWPASRAPLRLLAAQGALVLLAAAAGALLYSRTLALHPSLGGATAVNWLDFRGMADNLLRALQGMTGLLGGLPQPGTPVASGAGLLDALRMMAALAVLALAPGALWRCLGARDPGLVFFGSATLASLGASLFIYVSSSMPLAGAPESSARYLVPGLLWLLLACVAMVERGGMGLARRLVAGAALGVLALSAPLAYDLAGLARHAANGGVERANPALRLARFLEGQGLRYGYATFWQAGQLTVLSGGAVKVRQIQFENRLPAPMRHLSANRWYEPGAWSGASFLLLSAEEAAGLDLEKLTAVAGTARRLRFEAYEIIAFDHNIAADFPNWRLALTAPARYGITPLNAHAIGRYDAARRALVAQPGEAGALHFGPYQRLAAGRYLATFELRVEPRDGAAAGAAAGTDNGADIGSVDVAAGDARGVLASRPITGAGTQRITLPLVLDAAAPALEFRVFSSGAARISLLHIELNND